MPLPRWRPCRRDCELFYALKANSERPIIEALAGIVAGFEVGSAGEIELVRAAAPGAPIIFGGPGKTDAALSAAAREGVAAVHVESLHELRRAEYVAAGLGVTLPVALRVNLAGPLPVATLAMAGRPTQFGIDEADVPDALALVQHCGHLELVGFHFHCLSNHHDAAAHARLVAGYLQRARSLDRRGRRPFAGGERRWRHRRRLRPARPSVRLDGISVQHWLACVTTARRRNPSASASSVAATFWPAGVRTSPKSST